MDRVKETEDSAAGMMTPASLATAPGFVLRRLQQAYGAIWSSRIDSDVTGPQYAVLVAIDDRPGSDQGSIAASVALDTSTMADVARRMEARGLVARAADKADGRRKIMRLTAEGREILSGLRAKVAEVEAMIMAGMEAKERDDFTRVVSDLADTWTAIAATTVEPKYIYIRD